MKTKDIHLMQYVAGHGKPQTALAMKITRQRVQQMTTDGDNVYLRVATGGKVVGWYIYREV